MLLNWITPVTGLELSSCDIYSRQSKGNEIVAAQGGGGEGGAQIYSARRPRKQAQSPRISEPVQRKLLTLNHERIVMSLINQLLVGREVSLRLQSS